MESNHTGRLSYVPSQLATILSSRSMLSRDKRLPFETRNAPGLSTLGSPGNHSQGIHHGVAHKTQRETESVTSFARDDEPKRTRARFHKQQGQGPFFFSQEMTNKVGGTIPMPTFARRPSTMRSLFPVDIPQNSMVGQQRQQISELQFDKFSKTTIHF